MKGSLSVKQAIRRGLLVVNGPVLVLLLGPLGVFALLIDHRVLSRQYNWIGLPVLLAGFVLAWLWWSLSVPRWRIWAYERVENVEDLKEQAVAVGLTWPEGHLLGRTEIKSAEQAQRERELDPPAPDDGHRVLNNGCAVLARRHLTPPSRGRLAPRRKPPLTSNVRHQKLLSREPPQQPSE
jgi:hypothetical protein